MNEHTITIEQSRYEELLDTETRSIVLAELMRYNGYINIEMAFRILGCNKDADRLKEKAEKDKEEHLKKYGEKMEIDE